MHPSIFLGQRGAAMIVSLVLLVAITLIGVFVMSGSHLEWLMSSNSRFQTDAEMRAEAALQDGENDVKNVIGDPNMYTWITSDAYYNNLNPAEALPADPRDVANWNGGSFITKNATMLLPAKYLVEYMGCINKFGGACNPCPLNDYCLFTYRVWAYAADSKGASRIVQSTYTQDVHATSPPPPPIYARIAFAQIDHDQPPNP